MNTNGSTNTSPGSGLPLQSSNITECQVTEPLPTLNNCETNCSLPPSYSIAINDSVNLKPYPVQPMIAEYVAAYDAQQMQLDAIDAGTVTPITPKKDNSALKGLSALGVFAGIFLIIWRTIRIIRAVNEISNEEYQT